MHPRTLLIAALIVVQFLTLGVQAEDTNGLRLLVTKKTLDRADGKPGYMKEIDRTMALKGQIKNISNQDLPDGKISSVVLIRRWTTETGSVERYAKEVKLDPMRTAQELELLVGEYHIGGHMHGTSDRHVDQVAAWKITVEYAGKKIEFLGTPDFESMNKRASDAR
jgi:hypothetical protein